MGLALSLCQKVCVRGVASARLRRGWKRLDCRLWKTGPLSSTEQKRKDFNASLELQCRETMEIRTKHFEAGSEASFEAGLKGLKAMEIGAKQCEKEGGLFWSSKRNKKQARKNGPPPSSRFHSQLLLVKLAST